MMWFVCDGWVQGSKRSVLPSPRPVQMAKRQAAYQITQDDNGRDEDEMVSFIS